MYDVAIIGAGVIGCSVARELSRFNIKTIALEKGPDVSVGASRANSGIVHGGYDAKPGTLKAKYNVLGQQMFERLSSELDFPFKRNGSLVVAFGKDGLPELERLMAQGETNGLKNLSIIYKDGLLQMEPNLNSNVYAALVVPEGGITSPYEMAIAVAENATSNGVVFKFNCEATNISKINGVFSIETTGGVFESHLIINAAGLYSDSINNMLSSHKLKIIPRRGEYCLFDKTESSLVTHTIFQLPTDMGKGILVTPTADGNLLVGPTSNDINDKSDISTTAAGLSEVLSKGSLSVGKLNKSKIITSFSGLRAHLGYDDFIVGEAPDVPGLINLCGIESPGLTSAPAIAAEVADIVSKRLNQAENPNFNPVRKGIPYFRLMNNEERKAAIKENPDYGNIVCRCESVTKAEILQALRSPLGTSSMDSIKRRTRMGMGRCQGSFCSMRALGIIAEELGVDITEVTKFGKGTNFLNERNKESL
ncbi:MAG: NAD(P)/FAD-dependent oxidoreductase [Clostridiales bacterium]|nr:NAD(P)/FAD-dependent oxidoreductase [Clostridiales bacterium]